MKTKRYSISVFLLILGLFISGCGAQKPAPTPTSTNLPVLTVTATITPTATTTFPGQITQKDSVMLFIPAGTFIMGSNQGDFDEKPLHNVSLSPFYIDEYEVTNVLYKVCVDEKVCTIPKNTDIYYAHEYDNYPVVYLTWDQAYQYCAWRGARLPTEAEWEYAARGPATGSGEERTYPWGEGVTITRLNPDPKSIRPVGSYRDGKSPFGLYDMAGNAWEWVNDWYSDDYYQHAPTLDPQGPDGGKYKIVRGKPLKADGISSNARTADRTQSEPDIYYEQNGVRCALSQNTLALTPAAAWLPTNSPTPTPENTLVPGSKDILQKGAVMAYIPAGSFSMGSDVVKNEKPPHTVALAAFYMDKYEVTNALYKACVDAGGEGCTAPGKSTSITRISYYDDPHFDNYPVIYVSHTQAKAYCAWRGGRLPSEAEWEYAARGPDGRIYPWGNQGPNPTLAAFYENSHDTQPVGSYENGKSPFGLYDMAGNVWEWVNDWYDENYYPSSPAFNPRGPDFTRDPERSFKPHVIRSGDFESDDNSLRTSMRFVASYADYRTGFRCALSSSMPPTATPIPSPYPPEYTQKDSTMLLIPAGSFVMGSDNSREEEPPHIVSLPAFYLDKYEVTNTAYEACTYASVEGCTKPYINSLSIKDYYGNIQYANYPAAYITWTQANAYCTWRGARLPTEAEWEYAARGPMPENPTGLDTERIYPWGDTFIGKNANFCDKNCPKTFANQNYDDQFADLAPVDSFPQSVSPFGIFNMAGNVAEWVFDRYDKDYYKNSPEFNPQGAFAGNIHILRGGGYIDYVNRLSATFRYQASADFSNYDFGFRCALTP